MAVGGGIEPPIPRYREIGKPPSLRRFLGLTSSLRLSVWQKCDRRETSCPPARDFPFRPDHPTLQMAIRTLGYCHDICLDNPTFLGVQFRHGCRDPPSPRREGPLSRSTGSAARRIGSHRCAMGEWSMSPESACPRKTLSTIGTQRGTT